MFGSYCTYACQAVIVLVLVLILGYIVLSNEKGDKAYKRVSEKFTEPGSAEDKEKRQSVKGIFTQYMNREPTAEEYEKYVATMRHGGDIVSLTNSIKRTNEYKLNLEMTKRAEAISGKALPSSLGVGTVVGETISREALPSTLGAGTAAGKNKTGADAVFSNYLKVVDAYNKVLNRIPNKGETTYYSNKMKADPTFDVAKLEKILYGSREYQILEKNQSNLVFGELPGNITNAQITMEVQRIYAEVFGDGSVPSKDFEEFLKDRYLQYSLDEKRLKALLLLLREVDKNNVKTCVDGSVSVVASGSNGSANVYHTIFEESAPMPPIASREALPQPTQTIYNSPNIFNIISPSPQDLDEIMNRIDKYELDKKMVRKMGASACYTKDQEKYTDPFTLNMMAARDETQNRARNVLAEALDERKFADLKNTCAMSSYFNDVEDKLASQNAAISRSTTNKNKSKENTEPASYEDVGSFGAPLKDAKENTAVGSIMPAFIYKESQAVKMA